MWQGRFYSCVLDEPHLLLAARYIERNPVRAKLVKKPWEWEWSSASMHIGKRQPVMELEDIFKITDMTPDSWREYIDTKEEEKELEEIRKYSLTGRPLGATGFIEKLEKRFSKRLLALPRGRPRKSKE